MWDRLVCWVFIRGVDRVWCEIGLSAECYSDGSCLMWDRLVCWVFIRVVDRVWCEIGLSVECYCCGSCLMWDRLVCWVCIRVVDRVWCEIGLSAECLLTWCLVFGVKLSNLSHLRFVYSCVFIFCFFLCAWFGNMKKRNAKKASLWKLAV